MVGSHAHSDAAQGESLFLAEVRRVFSPLLARAGLAEVRAEGTFVEFEGHGVFVNLVHGRISREIRVEMGVTASRERRGFALSNLIAALGGDMDTGWYGGSTDDRVRTGIRIVAEAFEEYAVSRLDTPEDVSRIENQISSWNSAFRRREEIKRARLEAASAWREKRYEKVIELYRQLDPADLTPVDRKRLELAERNLRGGG